MRTDIRIEERNIHGTSPVEVEIYTMPRQGDYWASITDVRCPVPGCQQTLVWYEAGYVPGYRVCMRRITAGTYDHDSLRHRFQMDLHSAAEPTLIRDACCEDSSLAVR